MHRHKTWVSLTFVLAVFSFGACGDSAEVVYFGGTSDSISDQGDPHPESDAGRTTGLADSTIEDLRTFALELINSDRLTHGAPPVQLGANQAAQLHAEDSVRNGYLAGHWTSTGLKPYMIYTQMGGLGMMAENAAGQGILSQNCDNPMVICPRIDVQSAISDLQWSMVYDDGTSDWGHRDTIINPDYDTVHIGIAFTDRHVAYYQHFEYTRLAYRSLPTLESGILHLHVQPLGTYGIGLVAIYYDPPPTPKRPEDISRLTAYCAGGGFTDKCESVEPVVTVLEPPPEGSYYLDLDTRDVIAHLWNLHQDESVAIEADLSNLVSREGVYTVIIFSDSGDPEPLAIYSIGT